MVHPDPEEAIILSRAAVLQAQNISLRDYELGGLDIGPEWQTPVLDTLPFTQMMREAGVIFSAEDGVSAGRAEYECRDGAMPGLVLSEIPP